jgi:cysteine desulfurase
VDEIYLDNAATTRPRPEVLAAVTRVLGEGFGNPSSLHRRGVEAARALEDARVQVALALGREPVEVVFTSGGTEANNLALRGVAQALKRRGDHVVVTTVEHSSVLEPVRALEREGFRVSLVPVLPDGRIDPLAVVALVEEKTILVSCMAVQNETGAVFPVEAIASRVKAKRPGLVFHADAVQSFGKRPPLSRAVDLVSISSHKIHGPQGAGALAVSKGTRLLPLLVGGGQESGMRGGTENLPAIVGFGVAAELARRELPERRSRAEKLRERLRAGVLELGGVINSPEDSVATTLNASFPGTPAEPLLHALESRGVLLASGAACNAKKLGHGRSYVLAAMGLSEERIQSSLRFSFGFDTTDAHVVGALAALKEALAEVRGTVARVRG